MKAMPEPDAAKAPLLDHLIELRRRLLWSVAALAVAFIGTFLCVKPIYAFLVQPLIRAGHDQLIFTRMFEAFFVEVKVAFFAAVMLAFPVIANQLWQFVAPGLYARERRAVRPFLLATPILFLAGAALAYYMAIPFALHFLLGFEGDIGGVHQQALPAAGDYLTFIMQFMFGFGLAFLLPVLLLLLELAGIVTRAQLAASRRYAIVAAVVIAAVLTPPDPGSQLLLAIPLILLYEITLIVIWVSEKRRMRVAAPAESAEKAGAE